MPATLRNSVPTALPFARLEAMKERIPGEARREVLRLIREEEGHLYAVETGPGYVRVRSRRASAFGGQTIETSRVYRQPKPGGPWEASPAEDFWFP